MTAGTELRARHVNLIPNTLTIARRNLLHIKANPEQLFEMTIQPLMFLVLFVYVFGGAIAGSSSEYLQFALPGIIIQGIAFTPFVTALGLNSDFSRGLIDRFRSLPIARPAVVTGRIAADTVRIVWSMLIMVGFGMLLGFRFGGGLAGALGAFVLVTAFGITMCWPMAFIGVMAKSPESVNTWGFVIILPLTFLSSAFVETDTMPAILEAIANVNPLTALIDATRGLMLGGPVSGPLLRSIAWLIALTAIFSPLTVARYRTRLR